MKKRGLLACLLLLLFSCSLLTGCSFKKMDALWAELPGDWLLTDEEGGCAGVLTIEEEGRFLLETQKAVNPYCTGRVDKGKINMLPDLALLFETETGESFHGWVDAPGQLTLNDKRVLKKGTRPADFASPVIQGQWVTEDGRYLLQSGPEGCTLNDVQQKEAVKQGTLYLTGGNILMLSGAWSALGSMQQDGSSLTLTGIKKPFYNTAFPPAPKGNEALSKLQGSWLYFDGGALLDFDPSGDFVWHNSEKGTKEQGRFRITEEGILCVTETTVYPCRLTEEGKLYFGPYEGYFYFDDHKA